MKKMHFEITINAKPEQVWDAIVNDKKYREWTSEFQEGSYFEGGWNKGDKIQFLALNEKGEKEGMFSEIAESKKPSFISIRNLGTILGGKEDTTSEEAKKGYPPMRTTRSPSKGRLQSLKWMLMRTIASMTCSKTSGRRRSRN